MDKRVVIAGMGDTGILAATLLQRHADVVGISTKPMFVSGQEIGARLARPEQWRRDYLMEFSGYRKLHGVEVVHGAAQQVDLEARRVTVAQQDGSMRDLPYDALVIATGTTNGFWRTAEVQTREQVEQALAVATATCRSATSVLVVGGGPSGVSAASQLADVLRDATISLAHSAEVLPDHHPRTRATVMRHLTQQGVHLLPGHRAVVPNGATTTLAGGTVHWQTGQPPTSADVVVWAVGRTTPNTAWLPAQLLDDDGFVAVEGTFEVSGHPGVFAIGDVAATDPLRSSARNFGHRILAHNVRLALSDRAGRMRRFRPPKHRWGSVLGLQDEGMRIFTPTGHNVRLNEPATRRILFPVLTHRLLYGGLRSSSPDGD